VNPARRKAFAIAAALAAAAIARAGGGAAPAQRVGLVARRFEFIPAEITVARGTHLTLVVASADFLHGFAMPDFGVRRDAAPGQVLEVTITPEKPGRYHYLCDNFCGDGHDRMSGILVVT
jgi:cytochrome c oxidase subunit 2